MQRKLLAVGLICVVFLAGCGEPGPGVNGTDTTEVLDGETPTDTEVDTPTDTEEGGTPTVTPIGNETTDENAAMNETATATAA